MGISHAPVVYVIGGPNGAGKTTFAREFLPAEGVLEFLNADLLAAGLAPLWPEAMAIRAARLLLNRWRELVAKVDFAFESTLSGRTYAGMLREAKCVGYVVKSVPSAFLTRNSLCAAYLSACLRGAYRASGGCAPTFSAQPAESL